MDNNSKLNRILNDIADVISTMMENAIVILGPVIIVEQIVIAITNFLK